MSANELGTLEEADAPPDPMDPFADEAANRLEQDVLMATNGIRPRTVMRRIARYKKYMTQPAALQIDFVQKYKDQLVQAAAASCVLTPYVAGDEIQGDALRSFRRTPLSLVLWCVTCARTPLSCTTQTLLPSNRKSTRARTSTASESSS